MTIPPIHKYTVVRDIVLQDQTLGVLYVDSYRCKVQVKYTSANSGHGLHIIRIHTNQRTRQNSKPEYRHRIRQSKNRINILVH